MIDHLAGNPWFFWISWVVVMGGSGALLLVPVVRSWRKGPTARPDIEPRSADRGAAR